MGITDPEKGDALLIVDVQNDFLPGGALGVPHGDEIIPALNCYIDVFLQHSCPIFASRDWHPAEHCSFRDFDGISPVHCIAGTHGAAFPQSLALPPWTCILSKADSLGIDAYSAFENTGLEERLREAEVTRIFIGGLATEYCVLNTVRDALGSGFAVVLLLDAIRAIDTHRGDSEAAIAEMLALGAQPGDLDESMPVHHLHRRLPAHAQGAGGGYPYAAKKNS
jgi:nicotinamidase/pyrazinamidase